MPASLLFVKDSKGVQNNIEKFESLSIAQTTRSPPSTEKAIARPVVEISSSTNDREPPPLIIPASTLLLKPTVTSAELNPSNITPKRPRPDSAIFLQRGYLQEQAHASLPDDAREILKCQPSLEDIAAVLTYLQCGIDGQHNFNIKTTNPKASLLVQVLVNTTISDVWPILTSDPASDHEGFMRTTILQCLTSVIGLEALLGRIVRLSSLSLSENNAALKTILNFLTEMLYGSKIIFKMLQDMTRLYSTNSDQRLFWQSTVSLFAGSKILVSVARAHSSLHLEDSVNSIESSTWLAEVAEYSKWLAENIAFAATKISTKDSQSWICLSQLTKRAMSLGDREGFVSNLYKQLLLGAKAYWTPLHQLMSNMSDHDQRVIIDTILNDTTKTYFSHQGSESVASDAQRTKKAISGVAALVSKLISHNLALREHMIEWIIASNTPAAGNVFTRRAMVALLADSQGALEMILEKSLITFGDKVHIQHAAYAKHEQLCQTILLALGRLRRGNTDFSKRIQSSHFVTNAVSNRLSSPVPRMRLLGMTVAVAVSRCADDPDRVLNFKVEEMETSEVQELLDLMNVDDEIGSLEDLLSLSPQQSNPQWPSKKRKLITTTDSLSSNRAESQYTTKVTTIEEVSSSSDDEPDLVPYQKPAHDPEDSDDDPTLINRDKSKPPIYITQLVQQLSLPSDKLAIILLALKNASSLIRRKASFGTELGDNIHGLVSVLINLREGVEDDEQQQQRLDALVACVVALPRETSRDLINVYFNGDLSLAQRSTLLVALGLGARELAGFSDAQTQRQRLALETSKTSQPPHAGPRPITTGIESTSDTKQRSAAVYTSNAVALLTSAATTSLIAPLAQSAAESITKTPEILKISQITRTSAGLSKKTNQASSTRKTPKDLYLILVNDFFVPLVSPLTALLSYSGRSSLSTHGLLHPSTLTLHIQSMTLLLHNLGPVGLSPPNTHSTVTHETLLLLSALSNQSSLSTSAPVLPAMLALLLALIDITVDIGVSAQERLIAGYGTLTSELVRWTASLEEKQISVPSKDDEETGAMPWPVLAAGIQVRWHEIGRRFQARFLGLSVDDY